MDGKLVRQGDTNLPPVRASDVLEAHSVTASGTTGAADLRTDVLVIGSGPAGGGSALALAALGVDHMVITKYRWTANTPRAHITNQRTMEIFRDLGIEDEVIAKGTPNE